MSDAVLFLCQTNSCRSQMAEAMLKRLAPGRFEVCSAGLHPTEIHPLTFRVMNELGCDLEGQRSKGVREFFRSGLAPRFAIILCDIAEPDCPKIYPGALQVLRWPFDDPAAATGSGEERLLAFRRVRDSIHERIKEWLSEISD
jgi:arsenate reductase (thioredoxin)